MVRQLILAASVAAFVAPPGARAADEPAPFDDAAFLKAVATGGMYDAYLGNLVGSQTRNRAVRKLAAHIVADRMVGGTRLKAIANEVGVELPAQLNDADQKRYEAFKTNKGEDLDRDFVRAMAQRHAVGVALFTQASKEAKSPTVRAFAAKTLPLLQEHLETAKGLDK